MSLTWPHVRRAVCVFAAGLFALAAMPLASAPQPEPAPTVHDRRLRVQLFASAPDIATPIGIAVDERDRIFVLESHTHLQASDYPGPRSDRVKIFTDANADGRPDHVSIFADGIEDGMNIAFSAAGELFVVTSRSVWTLHDRDRDGVSEARTRVLQMVKPDRVYDHAALLGLAFSRDGWLYVSRGNTGSAAWRVEGTDGSSVRGYGDGGNIIRCRPDGSHVEEVATGFWNPFDLQFDSRGRLLATDNDPDSRGPNRLLHIVRGGDYGYKSLYGGSGIHPYLAWNGELPGTLPYAAALGEAPAGLLVGARTALPADYRDDVLVAIWEERAIVRVRMTPRGASIGGQAVPLIEGGDRFRPVSFAADRRGAVYFTDWGKREYPNHGDGRIWRLTARAAGPGRPPPQRHDVDASLSTAPGDDKEPGAGEFERLRRGLLDDDPFVRHASVMSLSHPAYADRLLALAADSSARIRLGALLALERSRHRAGEVMARRFLDDPDLTIRRMALIWIGRSGMTAARNELDRALTAGDATRELFDVYLATVQQLSPGFVRAYAGEAMPLARQIERRTPAGFIEDFIADASRPASLRAMAIAHLGVDSGGTAALIGLAARGNPEVLRTEAIQSLASSGGAAAGAALLAIARDRSDPEHLRADALVGLARQLPDGSADVLPLLDDAFAAVRIEAARYLRTVRLPDATRTALRSKAARVTGPGAAAVRAQLEMLTAGVSSRPRTLAQWSAAVGAGAGDAAAGRRAFFSGAAGCSACHVFNGRGGDLGPDLTNVGLSKTARQILTAILRPSAEISPEYQGWFVKTADGRIHTGRQVDILDDGKAELYVTGGAFIKLDKVVEYGPMPTSLMPEGLAAALTVQDMRDILALLTPRDRQPDRRPEWRR